MESLSKEKKLLFVTVYDRLYKMINDGTFSVGEALPSEPRLAEMLGVSRMTLRQALELLHEDGVIEKVKGKGNFVIDHNKPIASSLEKLGNPIYKCSKIPIDVEVELDFRIEPASEYEINLFQKRTPVVVALDRWYRSKGEVVAYTLSLMPIETVSLLNIDLNDKAALLQMLEEEIYQVATRAHLKVQATMVGDFISDRYVLAENGELMLVYENLYSEDELSPLVNNKHYMLPHACSIEIHATGDGKKKSRDK